MQSTTWMFLLWLVLASGVAAAKPQTSIHWRDVPLRDAVARLEEVFQERVFVDRRVDPTQRVSLDVEISRIEDVLTPLAAPRGLGISRVGRLVYLGPQKVSEQLLPIASLRAKDIAQLPARERAILQRATKRDWPRLTEPRELVRSIVEQRDWRVEDADLIPHDLWPAGSLPEMPFAEQLTVLLLGFDLTFELRPSERMVGIVKLDAALLERVAEGAKPQAAEERVGRRDKRSTVPETHRVYTLRVAEQPVRAVLQELSRRLNWQIEIDEAAIRATGGSLDERVSFAVTNVGADALLDALLRPVGLTFRREGERIWIVPQ